MEHNMEHFEEEELYCEGSKICDYHKSKSRKIQKQEIELKALELRVTYEYYMMEFM